MHRRTADVIVPVYRDVEVTWACLESVLEHSGDALGTVIIVDDASPDAEMRPMLRALRDREPRVRLVENEQNLGFVRSCNLGLALRAGHAVVLNSDTRVTPGWLEELLGVLDEAPRAAAVCPLSNNATLCSVPEYVTGSPAERLEGVTLPLEGVPRWTPMPTGVGFCLLLRDEALALLGPFDPAYGRGYHEENDWCQRAQAAGLVIARANRAFVFHLGQHSFGADREQLEAPNARRLLGRYPGYLEQNHSFDQGPHARLAATAVRTATGRLRVCVDVGGGEPGAWEAGALAPVLEALAGVEQVEMHVRPADAAARAALPPSLPLAGAGPFDVVHRAGPIDDEATLRRLTGAPGHLVLEWPGPAHLVAPPAHAGWPQAEESRACHWAAAQAAQRVVVSSRAERESLLAAGAVDDARCALVAPAAMPPAPGGPAAGCAVVFDDGALSASLVAALEAGCAPVVLLQGPWRRGGGPLPSLPAGARAVRPAGAGEAAALLASAAVVVAPVAEGLRARLVLGALGAGVAVVTTAFSSLAELAPSQVVVSAPGGAALARAVASASRERPSRPGAPDRFGARARAEALARVWLDCAARPVAAAADAHAALAGLLRRA